MRSYTIFVYFSALLFILLFLCEVEMPLKGAKKKAYNKKYYTDNTDKISEKKRDSYREELDKSCADSAARSKSSYDKDIKKSRADSAARRKEAYNRDPKSAEKSAARSKSYYHEDIEKSRADSAARGKSFYDKDVNKSRADSAARSKANYEHDIVASRTRKKQRYVPPCVCSLLMFYVLLQVFFEATYQHHDRQLC